MHPDNMKIDRYGLNQLKQPLRFADGRSALEIGSLLPGSQVLLTAPECSQGNPESKFHTMYVENIVAKLQNCVSLSFLYLLFYISIFYLSFCQFNISISLKIC